MTDRKEFNDEELQQVNGGTGEGCTGDVSYHQCKNNEFMMDIMSPGLYSKHQNPSTVVRVDENDADGGFSYYPVIVEFDTISCSWKEIKLNSHTQKCPSEQIFYDTYPYKVTLL